MEKNFYTEQQLADELNVDIKTIYCWRKHYGLKGIKVGKEYAHSVEQINEFFRRNAGKCVSVSHASKKERDNTIANLVLPPKRKR